MSDDFFDFGFTAVDENELPAVKDVNIKAEVYEAKGLDTQEQLRPLKRNSINSIMQSHHF